MGKLFYVLAVVMLANFASADTVEWSFATSTNSVGDPVKGEGTQTVDTTLGKAIACTDNDIVYTEDALDFSGGITVEALVKLSDNDQQYLAYKPGVFLVQMTSDGHLQAGTYYYKDGVRIWRPLVHDNQNLKVGEWQDVVFTYDNKIARLYINGKQVGSNSSTGPIQDGGETLYFCNRPDKDRDLVGTVERVSISDYAMSATTIATKYGGLDVPDEATGVRPIGITYRTQAEVVTALNSLDSKYPTQVSSEVIGKTLLGKDITMFKIGNPSATDKFMFTGKLHGPEDCGTETGFKFVQHILTANTAQTKSILSQVQLLFIPGINLDIPARQNKRRSYSDGTQVPHGVDLNRNFPHNFGRTGSSNSYDPYAYRGKAGNSEPETQAVTAAMRKYKPQVFMDVHCGMQTLVGYKNNVLSNTILTKMKEVSAQTYGSQTGTKYNPHLSGTVAGGYAAYQALEYGGSGWLFEVANWADMPASLQGYHDRWWKHSYPVYMGMALALV